MAELLHKQSELQKIALQTPSGKERIKLLAKLQLISIEINLKLRTS